MAIVGTDGTPNEAGSKILLAIKAGMSTPDQIVQFTGLPLFVITSGLHEMERYRLVRKFDNSYILDERGKNLLS